MNAVWPWMFLLLLLVPLLIALYLWSLRRKKRFTVRHSNLALIKAALPKRSRLRQHLPFALFMLAVTSLIGATARPVFDVEVPLSRTTIILALDISLSMCATDVDPNRLTVAQDAALAFVAEQDAGTQIGLVAFAGFAETVLPPTSDKEVLSAAISNLTTSLGTAIGSATLKSIDAISEVNEKVAASGVDLSGIERALGEDEYQPEIVVLLTDGANTEGPQPFDAAQQAVDRQVRVYTIGFGTENPTQLLCPAEQLGPDPIGRQIAGGNGGGFGGFGGFGGDDLRRFLVIDEATLRGVSEMTGGAYFRAESAEELVDVFRNLPSQIVLQRQALELSVGFAFLGAVFALGAVGLSLWWNRYP